PFAVAMAIFLLGAMRLLETYPRVTFSGGSIAGVGFGLAFGSRILGAFGALAVLIALALLFIAEARAAGARVAGARLIRFVAGLVPVAILAYAVKVTRG